MSADPHSPNESQRRQIIEYLCKVYQGRAVSKESLESLPWDQLVKVYGEVVAAQQSRAVAAQQAQQQAAAALAAQQQAAQRQAAALAAQKQRAEAAAAAAAAAARSAASGAGSAQVRAAENPLLILKLLLEQHPQIHDWLKSVQHLEVVMSSAQHAAQFLQSLMESQPNFKAMIATLQQQLMQTESAAHVSQGPVSVMNGSSTTSVTTTPSVSKSHSSKSGKRSRSGSSKKDSSRKKSSKKRKRSQTVAEDIPSEDDDNDEDWQAPSKSSRGGSSRKRKRASETSSVPRKRRTSGVAGSAKSSLTGNITFSPASLRWSVLSVTDLSGASKKEYLPRMRLRITANPLRETLPKLCEEKKEFDLVSLIHELEKFESERGEDRQIIKNNRETRRKLEKELLQMNGVTLVDTSDPNNHRFDVESYLKSSSEGCTVCLENSVDQTLILCDYCEMGSVHMKKCAGFEVAPEGKYKCPECVRTGNDVPLPDE